MNNQNKAYSLKQESKNQLQTINHKVHFLIDNLQQEKLYAINYGMLKDRFIEEINKYKKYPELIDIDEFSMNYSFGYHYLHEIENPDSQKNMFLEIKSYLHTLKLSA